MLSYSYFNCSIEEEEFPLLHRLPPMVSPGRIKTPAQSRGFLHLSCPSAFVGHLHPLTRHPRRLLSGISSIYSLPFFKEKGKGMGCSFSGHSRGSLSGIYTYFLYFLHNFHKFPHSPLVLLFVAR